MKDKMFTKGLVLADKIKTQTLEYKQIGTSTTYPSNYTIDIDSLTAGDTCTVSTTRNVMPVYTMGSSKPVYVNGMTTTEYKITSQGIRPK